MVVVNQSPLAPRLAARISVQDGQRNSKLASRKEVFINDVPVPGTPQPTRAGGRIIALTKLTSNLLVLK
eukprot:3814645-Amphidinium_carterae.1